jgi:hypothetical protein
VHAGGKLVQNYFLHEWKRNLQAQDNGKLSSYVLSKSNFGCEKYFFVINNIEIRKHFTRLRLSAHSLRIEKGSHQGIPRHNRTCPRCSSNEVEDELHFLLTCSALHSERESLIQCITDNCINFIKLSNKDKFIWLMNNENKDILITLCSYIQNNERCG